MKTVARAKKEARLSMTTVELVDVGKRLAVVAWGVTGISTRIYMLQGCGTPPFHIIAVFR